MPSTVVPRHLRLSMETARSVASTAKTTAYTMTPRDVDLKVDSTNAPLGFTVTLPPVAECTGLLYIIRQMASGNPVTVVDRGDALVAISSTLGSLNAAFGFRSNGERWFLEWTLT